MRHYWFEGHVKISDAVENAVCVSGLRDGEFAGVRVLTSHIVYFPERKQ